MSWEQHLNVVGGNVYFRPTGADEQYSIEGFVECNDDWVVRFRKFDCTPARCPFPDSELPRDFEVHGHRIELARRKPRSKPDGPQPTSFLDLCQKLLVPSPRERYGYEFSASLQLNGWQPDPIRLRDEMYLDGSIIQFAQFREPFNFVEYNSGWDLAHYMELGQFQQYTPREMFELILKVTYRWPLRDE